MIVFLVGVVESAEKDGKKEENYVVLRRYTSQIRAKRVVERWARMKGNEERQFFLHAHTVRSADEAFRLAKTVKELDDMYREATQTYANASPATKRKWERTVTRLRLTMIEAPKLLGADGRPV